MTGASGVSASVEIANYLRRCSNPREVIPAALAFATRARAALALRLAPQSVEAAQPPAVRAARIAMAAATATSAKVPASVRSPASLPPRALTLTAGAATVRTAADWHQTFADPEIASSLHRWNWLLYGITTDDVRLSRDDGITLMRSWLDACGTDARYSGAPYTTGERLVNGLLFLTRDASPIPADLAAAFRSMARDVAAALEYRPDGMTGNHAFNNARALLFAAVFADLPGARDLAYAIASERLSVLVTADGFMREGSSHYHILFTRWVLEMLWAATRSGDGDFVRLLSDVASRLVERCWFFLVRQEGNAWQMPLIGDVSPDFPPAWLVSLPWSTLAREAFTPRVMPPAPTAPGWATMFEARHSSSGEPNGAAIANVACWPDGGWCRADVGVWTLLVRARPHDGRLRSGHEHADLTSYTLFRDGDVLIADCGRHDYSDRELGSYGRSARAHTAPIIDGLGSMADGPTWLSGRYTRVDVALSAVKTATGCRVIVEHSGFKRLARTPILHRRELLLEPTGLTVTDHLVGTGSCDVELPLHFGPDVENVGSGQAWQLANSRGMVSVDAALAVTAVPESMEHPHGGLYFPAYGEAQRIVTLRATGRVALPITLHHALHDEPSHACVA